jgi:hypothetical protein
LTRRYFSFCLSVGSFTLVASPSFCSPQIMYQVLSTCHQWSQPWRADHSKVWWLLCQPSPNARIATHLVVGRLV